MTTGHCARCGKSKRLLVHHINRDHADDTPSNRTTICYRCHSLQHLDLGVPGRRPRSEYVLELNLPPLSAQTIREQYERCFPRS